MPSSVPKRLSLSAALVILLCGIAIAGTERLESGGLTVVYQSGFEGQARITMQVYEQMRASLKDRLGTAPGEPVIIELCATQKQFDVTTGGRHDPATLGLAYPQQDRIVINCVRAGEPGYNDLRTTVRHELCHLAIGAIERSGQRRVPYWFNEGLCVHISGRLPLPNEGWLPQYIARDIAIPLEDLLMNFPENPVALRVAYEQSVDIVRFIDKNFSETAIKDICRRVAQGETFDQAILAETGLTMVQLEQEWLNSLGMGNTLIAFFLRRFDIFALISVLALVAFMRYLIRRRRGLKRLEQLDDVEQGGPPEG